eukprot:2165507-Rhodomonas_salina.1
MAVPGRDGTGINCCEIMSQSWSGWAQTALTRRACWSTVQVSRRHLFFWLEGESALTRKTYSAELGSPGVPGYGPRGRQDSGLSGRGWTRNGAAAVRVLPEQAGGHAGRLELKGAAGGHGHRPRRPRRGARLRPSHPP